MNCGGGSVLPALAVSTTQIPRCRYGVHNTPAKYRGSQQTSTKLIQRYFALKYNLFSVLLLIILPCVARSQQNSQASPSHQDGFTPITCPTLSSWPFARLTITVVAVGGKPHSDKTTQY